jgi:hypothetical protein
MRHMPGMAAFRLPPRGDLASLQMASTRGTDGSTRRAPTGRAAHPTDDHADPKLRATTEMILAMPVDDRLRQLEAESRFFSSIRPLDG